MRGTKSASWGLAIGLCALILSPALAANLLYNPGMELDADNDLLADGWVRAEYAEPGTGSTSWVNLVTDPNMVHSGLMAQEMGITGRGYAAIHQTVPAVAGTAYTLSSVIRYSGWWTAADHPSGPPGDRAWMKLEFYNADSQLLNDGSQTYNFYYWYTYQERTMTRIAPPDTVAVRAVLGMQHWGSPAPNATSHWFQYDDAVLTPEPGGLLMLALVVCLRHRR